MHPGLQEWLHQRGYRMAVGDPGVLAEVRSEIQGRAAAAELEEGFIRTRLSGFRYGAEEGSIQGSGTTIILLAAPRPAHRITFRLSGRTLAAVLPPTYLFYRRIFEEIRLELAGLLGEGARLAILNAPLKAVAARLGLASYGRNNLAYVPGMGSLHQLLGFLAEGVDLRPTKRVTPRLLGACEACRACRGACPTGAIDPDRILLRAERCLTYLNEEPGSWPEWLPAAAHRSLVGCLACQEICPENKGLLRFEEVQQGFSQEETERILGGDPDETDPLWRRIEEKLAAIGLPGYGAILGRNLRALAAS